MAIDQLEMKLRPPADKLAPYPSKLITLASGEKMVVRECRLQDFLDRCVLGLRGRLQQQVARDLGEGRGLHPLTQSFQRGK